MYGAMPYMMPNMASSAIPSASASGLSSFFSKINLSSILSNTSKVLNVANQAIPLYYQVKPIFKNLKTLTSIGKEFSKIGNDNKVTSDNSNNIKETIQNNKNNDYKEEIPEVKFFI